MDDAETAYSLRRRLRSGGGQRMLRAREPARGGREAGPRSRAALLDRAEEVRLARAIEVGLFAVERSESVEVTPREAEELHELAKEGRLAVKKMVQANLGLVMSIARSSAVGRVADDFEDLVQAGVAGLTIALQRFDVCQGYKFSTYATPWIRKMVLEEVRRGRLIPIGDRGVRRLQRHRSAVQAFSAPESTGPVTDAQVARASGDSVDVVRHLRLLSLLPVSLNAPLFTTGDEEFGSLLESRELPVLEQALRRSQLRSVSVAMQRLTADQQRVLAARYGLGSSPPQSVLTTATRLRLLPEVVEELEQAAIELLRESVDGPREGGGSSSSGGGPR